MEYAGKKATTLCCTILLQISEGANKEFQVFQASFLVDIEFRILPTSFYWYNFLSSISENKFTLIFYSLDKGAFNNYVDRLLPFFDPPPPA